MAIKIPSKNIYEINNPKIMDNIINKVEISSNEVKEILETEVSVASEESSIRHSLQVPEGAVIRADFISQKESVVNDVSTILGGHDVYFSIIEIPKEVVLEVNFDIPELTGKELIAKLYYKETTTEELGKQSEVKYEVYGYTQKRNITQTITIHIPDLDHDESYIKYGDITFGDIIGEKSAIKKFDFNIPIILEKTFDGTDITQKLEYNIKDKSAVDKAIFFDGNYKMSVYVMSYVSLTKFSGNGNIPIIATSKDIEIIAECEEYVPTKVVAIINGDTIGIDLENNTLTYGSGNKPHSLSGNELLQDSGKVGDVALTEHLANNVLSQYAKGKETATLLCDIADYYDENGEKKIDIATNKMSFRLHDQVIPYVFGTNGQDQPMSRCQDGTAKVFEVVGSNIIYDGAVWQELTLQEK